MKPHHIALLITVAMGASAGATAYLLGRPAPAAQAPSLPSLPATAPSPPPASGSAESQKYAGLELFDTAADSSPAAPAVAAGEEQIVAPDPSAPQPAAAPQKQPVPAKKRETKHVKKEAESGHRTAEKQEGGGFVGELKKSWQEATTPGTAPKNPYDFVHGQ